MRPSIRSQADPPKSPKTSRLRPITLYLDFLLFIPHFSYFTSRLHAPKARFMPARGNIQEFVAAKRNQGLNLCEILFPQVSIYFAILEDFSSIRRQVAKIHSYRR
jgi:hypothetical protein